MMLFERVTKAAADLERMGREEIDKAHRAGPRPTTRTAPASSARCRMAPASA